MNLARLRALSLAALFTLLLAFSVPTFAFAAESEGGLAAGSVLSGEVGATSSKPSVIYAAHTKSGSWSSWVKDTAQAGKSKALDMLSVKLSSGVSGSIGYQVYVKGYGWQKARANGKVAGAKGKSYSIEAVRIALSGNVSKNYNVRYAVKTSKGWQTVRSNGGTAGKAGSGRPITAIKVQLVAKGKATAASGGVVGVRYRTAMKGGAWKVWQSNNGISGLIARSAKMRRVAMNVDVGAYSGSVYYRAGDGSGNWTGWKKNGTPVAISSGIQAIQVKLTGGLAVRYDVVYQVNIYGVGWQKRVRNGELAGSEGYGKVIRALRVQLVDKTKRTGWIGKGKSWKYYNNGKAVKNQWVVSKESPIDPMQGSADVAQRYWIDSTGKLALGRIVNPKNAKDSNAGFMAYAMDYGYIMRNETRRISGTWYTANNKGVLTKLTSKRKVLIEKYVQWALAIAADDSHGYSQATRWGPDYDCSSLVVSALKNTGFEVGEATWTGNMKSELTKYGFRWYTDMSKLQRGDILLVHNSSRQHTEIYIGNKKTVGAHIAETGGIFGVAGDQTGNEISVAAYSSIWQGFLRYIG